jgi:hypothetical protein
VLFVRDRTFMRTVSTQTHKFELNADVIAAREADDLFGNANLDWIRRQSGINVRRQTILQVRRCHKKCVRLPTSVCACVVNEATWHAQTHRRKRRAAHTRECALTSCEHD